MKRVLYFLFSVFFFLGASHELQAEDDTFIAGEVTEFTSGHPIFGASVDLIRGGKVLASVMTGEEGDYRFKIVEPGKYEISVSASGYQPQSRVVKPRSGRAISENFALVDRSLGVSGVITDADTGNPVADARVMLFEGQMEIGSAVSSDHGVYLIETEGFFEEGSVVVSASGYMDQSVGIDFESLNPDLVNIFFGSSRGGVYIGGNHRCQDGETA